MHWIDVCGPPGAGKSTICDHFWGPHAVGIDPRLPPQSWQPFIDEVTNVFDVIAGHPDADTMWAAIRMTNRSVRKIATVARMHGSWAYVQTALAQRVAGYFWRLSQMGADTEVVRPLLKVMPVSLGVCIVTCNPETVVQRNKERENIKATAHENRGFMVPLMEPFWPILQEEMDRRNVPVWKISSEQPIGYSSLELANLACGALDNATTDGCNREGEIFSEPAWWS